MASSRTETDSAAAAAAAARARAIQEAARRRAEEARQQELRRAEQARQAQAQQAQSRRAQESTHRDGLEAATDRPVDLNPPTRSLSAAEARAYSATTKVIAAKYPDADPHEAIAQDKELAGLIARSSAQLAGARGAEARDITAQLADDVAARLKVAPPPPAAQTTTQALTADATTAPGQTSASAQPTDSAPVAGLPPIATAAEARAELKRFAPDSAAAGASATPNTALMSDIVSAAEANSAGKRPQGRCLQEVQDVLESKGLKFPRWPYARNFAEHMNNPAEARRYGFQKLNIDNPYEAPAGSIVVVRAGTPGTAHPTAGDITIAAGEPGPNRRFLNDGEMSYGGASNFPKGNDYVLGIYAPVGKGGAAAASAAAGSGADGRIVKPIDTAMPQKSEFNNPDGPEGMPGVNGGNVHGGLDWFAPAGTPVKAPVNGTVLEVKASRGNSGQVFGGVVKVKDEQGRVFVFRHVDPGSVQQGQRVNSGQQLATVTAWTGGSPHCHMEVWKSESGGYNQANALDPLDVYKNGSAAATTGAGATVDAQALRTILPQLPAGQAREAAPVMQQALAAAGITDGRESAAFIAMVGQRTNQFRDQQSYAMVVDTAKQWKAERLGRLVQDDSANLNGIAKRLGMEVSPDQLNAGDRDARIARELDAIFASKNPQVANQQYNGKTPGQIMVEAGRQNNVDPYVLLAIGGLETQYGTTGVGVSKMLGVSAYDSNPDGNFGMNGLENQLRIGAKTFAKLREAHGAGPNDPMEVQINAVNGYDQNGSQHQGPWWASDPTWQSKVFTIYKDLTKNGNGMGPPQVGEQYYTRALDALNVNPPPSSASSSSSGSASASSGGGSYSGGGSASGPTAPAGTPGPLPTVGLNDSYAAAANAAMMYGLDPVSFWGSMGPLAGDSTFSWAVESEPDFTAFARANGIPGYAPGKKLTAAQRKKLEQLKGRYLADKLGKNAQARGGGQAGLDAAAADMWSNLNGPMRMGPTGLTFGPALSSALPGAPAVAGAAAMPTAPAMPATPAEVAPAPVAAPTTGVAATPAPVAPSPAEAITTTVADAGAAMPGLALPGGESSEGETSADASLTLPRPGIIRG